MTISIASLIQNELEELVNIHKDPCISIYMPTYEAGVPSVRQNPIRFKNLLSEAEDKLRDRGLSTTAIDDILEPAREAIEPDNREFWQHQNQGLAMFLAEGIYYYYRLPTSFEEGVTVSDRFYVKPLLNLLSGNGRFYILALSLNQVRFFQATQNNLDAIDLENLPQGLEEALKYDEPARDTQIYTGAGDATAIRYGQGDHADENRSAIRRYFQKVDNTLHPVLNTEDAPLVLVGVDYLLPIFREASSYNHIFDNVVEGNPDHLKPEELHRLAWDVVEPHFQRAKESARSQFHELTGTGKATAQLQDILPAAYDGQIDTLFVARGQQHWGSYDPETRHLNTDDGQEASEDLLESAAIYTLLQGGTVYAVDRQQVPEDSEMAAIFRYPVVAGRTDANA